MDTPERSRSPSPQPHHQEERLPVPQPYPTPPNPVPDIPLCAQRAEAACHPGYHGIPRLSDFLRHHLQNPESQDLVQWVNRRTGVFRIYWLHGSRATFQERHRFLFQKWAQARDQGREELTSPSCDTVYKQRFRMALEKTTDIERVQEDNEGDWKYFRFTRQSNEETATRTNSPQVPNNIPEPSSWNFPPLPDYFNYSNPPTDSSYSIPDDLGLPFLPMDNIASPEFLSSSGSSTYGRGASISCPPDLRQDGTHYIPITTSQNVLDPQPTYVTFPDLSNSLLTRTMSYSSPELTPIPQGSRQDTPVFGNSSQNPRQESFGPITTTQGSYPSSESTLTSSGQHVPGHYDPQQHMVGAYGSSQQVAGSYGSPVSTTAPSGIQQRLPGLFNSPLVVPEPCRPQQATKRPSRTTEVTPQFFNPGEPMQDSQGIPVSQQVPLSTDQPVWQTPHVLTTMSDGQATGERFTQTDMQHSATGTTLQHNSFESQNEYFSYYNGYPVKCDICGLHKGQTCTCYGHN